MRQDYPIQSLPATGTIEAYRIVHLGAGGKIVQGSDSEKVPLGISMETATTPGEVGAETCAFLGPGALTYVVVGASGIAAGTPCMTDAQGRAVAATGGKYAACVVLESSTANNQLVRCQVVQFKV